MSALLAIDFRHYSEKLLEYAIEHSLAYDTLLFIVATVTSKDHSEMEKELTLAKDTLDIAKQKAAGRGVDVRIVTCAGNPAEEILAAAERLGTDAIIIGHRDKTLLDRAIMGSVSEHVVRNAKCTVIIVQ